MDVFNTFDVELDKATFPEVVKLFEEYCYPLKNETFERYKFWSRNQLENESIDNYITSLKNLANMCAFESQKDKMLRDKLVFGVNDSAVKERLLREASLDLKKAIEICRAAESSKSKLKQMTTAIKAEQQVYKISKTRFGSSVTQCGYCGSNHQRGRCPAFGATCSACGKRNHFKKVCRANNMAPADNKITVPASAAAPNIQIVRASENSYNTQADEQCDFFMGCISNTEDAGNWNRTIWLNGTPVLVKLDTGAEVNVLPLAVYKKLATVPPIITCKTLLTAFGGNKYRPLGKSAIKIQTSEATVGQEDEFLVMEDHVAGEFPIIGGESLLKHSLVCLRQVNTLGNAFENTILQKYSELFSANHLGKISYVHKINLKEDAHPVVNPPRKVPFAIKSKVHSEIKRMEDLGVIRKVDEPTDWVNSMVTVHKPNGDVRVCIDPFYLNKAIKRQHYPMNTIEEVAAKLSGAKFFTKLDAVSGFWQIPLDEDSSKLCTFNTPWGRFRFLRLPFGIADAPEVFQRVMTEHFAEFAEVVVDDLLVWGKSKDEHDQRLEATLRKASEIGVVFNKKKLELATSEVIYVGHKLTASGLQSDPEKVSAVLNMPAPKDKAGVMRLLGMVTYLGKFIRNLSTITAPLRQVMKKDVEFHWQAEQDKAFKKICEILATNPVLGYFDSSQKTEIHVDSSKYGIGCVLMQNDHPVAYGSYALTKTQQRYSTMEKEMLAVVIGCRKFHQYIFGAEKVQIISDHKPLEEIFNKDLAHTPARLTKMILQLKKYDIQVKWRPGKLMALPDALSRAHTSAEVEELDPQLEVEVHVLRQSLPMTEKRYSELQRETLRDEELQEVCQALEGGWPRRYRDCSVALKKFWAFKADLSIFDGVLYKQNKLVIPKPMRSEQLDLLHEGHLGIEKTRSLARQVMFWPGINQDIELVVKKCSACQMHQRKNQKEVLIQHTRPGTPWQKVGVDLMDFGNTKWLVMVDYYSNWIEILSLEK